MTILDGKTVLITGASRGIGAAAARRFAQDGARVMLASRDSRALTALTEEINTQNGKAEAFSCDVSSWSEVSRLVDLTHAKFGTVDVLINNAGVIDPISRLETSDPQDWRQTVNTNLMGAYHALRAVLPYMIAQRCGTVLNLSSGAATSALEGWSHYCATKAALYALTRCADIECRDLGVRVIGLSPGTVATDMQNKIRLSGINPVSRLSPDAHIPAEWVAKALAHLVGPEGDNWRGQDFSLKSVEGRRLVGLPQ